MLDLTGKQTNHTRILNENTLYTIATMRKIVLSNHKFLSFYIVRLRSLKNEFIFQIVNYREIGISSISIEFWYY